MRRLHNVKRKQIKRKETKGIFENNDNILQVSIIKRGKARMFLFLSVLNANDANEYGISRTRPENKKKKIIIIMIIIRN